jgi:hypothetical protein
MSILLYNKIIIYLRQEALLEAQAALQEARAAVAQAQAHLHLCQVQLTTAQTRERRERFLVENQKILGLNWSFRRLFAPFRRHKRLDPRTLQKGNGGFGSIASERQGT